MAELKNTVLIDGTEYDINAVLADTAKKTQAALTLKKSLSNSTAEESFNGSDGKTLEYVPATGGKYKGPVLLDTNTTDYISAYNSLSDDDKNKTLVNSGQVNNRIVNLTGAPLCVWDTSFNPSDMTKNLYALKESTDKVHNFTVITGTEDDLYMLQDAINGDYTTISQVTNYSIVSSSDHGLGIKTGALDSSVSGVVKVPGRYAGTYDGENKNNWLIRTISNSTFKGNTKITGVIIEEAEAISGAVIKTIEAQAFSGCSNLKFVTIPNSVSVLNESTFEGCSKLKKVILGASTINIKSGAFKGCSSLTSIIIPKSVTSIASDAFANCTNLKTVYYTGSELNWNAISISSGNDQIKNAQKVYNSTVSVQTSPSAPNAQVDISAISNSPILYICEDDESITIPASNKIFLRLPGDNNFTEISKGAARLESPKGATNTGYYTYETLAAIIAGINARLDGLGVKALPTKLPETESVIIPENLHTEVLKDDFDPDSVPTVDQLTAALVQLNGNTWDKDTTTTDNLNAVLDDVDKANLNLKAIRQDLNALTKEVYYSLDNPDNLDNIFGDALVETKSRLDNLESFCTIPAGYVTKAVGEVNAGQQLKDQGITSLVDLIKKLLGLQDTNPFKFGYSQISSRYLIGSIAEYMTLISKYPNTNNYIFIYPGFTFTIINDIEFLNNDLTSLKPVLPNYCESNSDGSKIIKAGTYKVDTNYMICYDGYDQARTSTHTAQIDTSGYTYDSNGGVYYKSIEVKGIKSTDQPIIDIDLTGVANADVLGKLKAFGKLGQVTTSDNKITVYFYNGTPATSFKIKLMVLV